jgi:hypothetical protein
MVRHKEKTDIDLAKALEIKETANAHFRAKE